MSRRTCLLVRSMSRNDGYSYVVPPCWVYSVGRSSSAPRFSRGVSLKGDFGR
jgi:hypothetical protein